MHEVIAIVVAGVAAFVILKTVRRCIIYDYEHGLLFTRGRFVKVLEPGVHYYLAFRSRIVRMDARLTSTTVPGQEILSADGVTMKVSLAVQYQIADPRAAFVETQDAHAALYQQIQLALRVLAGSMPVEEFLAAREPLRARLLETCGPQAAQLGLALVGVDIKDIMFAGEWKRIFGEVVKARKEGQAALEKARGETSALRNLLNAATLLESRPALLQLRLLQSAGSGNTVVLGMPGQAVPIPVRSAKAPAPPLAEDATGREAQEK